MRYIGMALLFSTLAGCAGNELDRSNAADLIADTPVAEDIHHDLGRPVFDCLRENDYVRANIMGARLTPEGQRFFRSLQFNSLHGESGLKFVEPVRLKKVSVTGITELVAEGDNSPKKIEFQASYSFTGIPEGSPAYQCLLKASTPFQGSATAQQYDDGWRITSWTLRRFNSVAM